MRIHHREQGEGPPVLLVRGWPTSSSEVTALPHCGHFLQEEDPERVGELLAELLTRG